MSVERLAIVSASGLFIGSLGYLIKNHGMMNLIAGYDPSQVRNEAGLAEFVGTNLYYVMLLTLLMGVVDYLGFRVMWIAYLIALFGFVVRMSRGSNRYS